MTYIITHVEVEEWEEEICDRCGHSVSMHYDEPKDIYLPDGTYLYTAVGCMVLSGKRKMNVNPYLRCECLHSE